MTKKKAATKRATVECAEIADLVQTLANLASGYVLEVVWEERSQQWIVYSNEHNNTWMEKGTGKIYRDDSNWTFAADETKGLYLYVMGYLAARGKAQ